MNRQADTTLETELTIVPFDVKTDFSTVKISSGYGVVTKGGVHAEGAGVQVTAVIDINVKAISENDFKTWFENTKGYFTDEQ